MAITNAERAATRTLWQALEKLKTLEAELRESQSKFAEVSDRRDRLVAARDALVADAEAALAALKATP